MAEFADNNALASSIGMSPFFANKGFHPRMSFGPDTANYTSTRDRLLAAKAEAITDSMANTLKVMTTKAAIAKETMAGQANKHRKEVSYRVGDQVFLSSRNIKTARPTSKLEDKMLGHFKIKALVGASYQLELPSTMKIHDVFHPSLLRKDPGDPLPIQVQPPPGPIIVDDNEEWGVEDILDSRVYGKGKKLQYRVQWKGYDQRDLNWYNADRGEFENAADLIDNFHKQHPGKPGHRPTNIRQP